MVGQKWVIHEFANSDKDNAEPMGLGPRVYKLTAIITGILYTKIRDDLLAAIEDPEPGVLIHPFYGRIENVVAMPVNYTETVRQLGRIEIPITFRVSDSDGLPEESGFPFLDILVDGLMLLVEGFMAGSLVASAGSYLINVNKIIRFGEEVRINTSITQKFTKTASAFKATVDTIISNATSLANSPDETAEAVTEIMASVVDLYETNEQVFLVAERFFSFGNVQNDGQTVVDSSIINPTTFILAERRKNLEVFNATVKTAALGLAYNAATLIEYKTVDEVDIVSRSMETAYQDIKASGTMLSQDTSNQLDKARNATQNILREQKLSAARIVTVETNTRPVSLIAFAYYGDPARAEDLIGINRNVNTPYYKGEIEVLTE
jgi:hypothetical protein